MSTKSEPAYHLRPNKAVDRALFLDLLSTLSSTLGLRDYRYYGLGGPFLEDFRLMHSRIGLGHLTCVEREASVHARQQFNVPVSVVECHLGEFEEFLRGQDLDAKPSVIWLDYSDPKNLKDRLEFFADLVADVAANSVLKITLNANPGQLGTPAEPDTHRLHEFRLEELRKELGNYLPAGTEPEHMVRAGFGRVLLSALRLAVERRLESGSAEFIGVCSSLYSDGQPMVTATGVVVSKGERESFIRRTCLPGWEFFRAEWWTPEVIDLPDLSTRERLTIEQALHAQEKSDIDALLGFGLPKSELSSDGDSFAVYRRFYRLYPHFARIDL